MFYNKTPQAATQNENDLRVPITILPALTASLVSSFLSFSPLVQFSQDNAYRHNAATMRQPYALLYPPFSRSFMLTYFSIHLPITGTPEVAATIQTLDTAERQRDVYKNALLLVEGASSYQIIIGLESQVFFPLLSSLTHLSARPLLSAIAWRNSCPRDLGRSSSSRFGPS